MIPSCVALYFNPTDERYQSLEGGHAIVPVAGHEVPIRSDDDVKVDFGTGLMMVCTFGDGADVQRWKRDGLELRMGVDAAGKMTEVAGAYAGLDTDAARKRIVADLEAAGAVRGSTKIEQQVAVSERTQRPTEFQMKPHWFVRVLDLADELLARSAELNWHPDYMKVRLDAWIEGLKYDWNITRQRFYGVPFPVWYCDGCGAIVLATEEQLPVDPLESAPAQPCPECGGTAFTGDPDVMDTWMTSSLTPHINANWAHSPDRPPSAPLPMTLRVQAYEIIRTWLFYTLVKSHLHDDTLPWTDVMMSGWGLNEQGKKFSKRDLEAKKEGQFNKYDPEDVIDKYGADALRFWAAGSHLGHDLRYHEEDVKVGRKLVLEALERRPARRAVRARVRPAHDRPDRRSARRKTVGSSGSSNGCSPSSRVASTPTTMRSRATRSTISSGPSSATTTSSWSRTGSGPRRATPTPQRASARSTLWEMLRTLLGLYAPFLPFVTEELLPVHVRRARGRAVDPRDAVARSTNGAHGRSTRDRDAARAVAGGAFRAHPDAVVPRAGRSPNSWSTPTIQQRVQRWRR